MQPKKQKKQITVFIIVGGIVLAALLLIAILWVTEDATASAYILEKIGVGSVEVLYKLLIRTIVVIAMLFLIFSTFLILVHQSRKNAKVLLSQEKEDNNQFREALDQIKRERTAMENIQAALGSGPWSMEFNERAEITSCI